MKNKLMRMTSKLAAAAMVASMFASVLPASADVGLYTVKDTLTREKVSVAATHTLVFNASEATTAWAQNETIIFSYSAAGFALDDGTPSCSGLSTGTCTAAVEADDDSVTVTCSDAAGCRGTVTLGAFTGTNPGSSGAKTITVGGTSDYGVSTPTDHFMIPIVDDDQVTINAHIDSTMVFDIDTTLSVNPADHEDTAPYDVDLGTLTSGAVKSSGDGSTNYIWLDLTHNATGGAVITVQSANAGLASVSVPADEIVSTSGDFADGAEHYGLCIEQSWDDGVTVENALFLHNNTFGLNGTAGDNTAACDNAVDTDMGAFTGSIQNLLSSADAIYDAHALLNVKAAISTVTPAHPDYADTLTFIATATF